MIPYTELETNHSFGEIVGKAACLPDVKIPNCEVAPPLPRACAPDETSGKVVS